MKNIYYYQIPLGNIAICEEEGLITNLFMEEEISITKEEFQLLETEEIRKTYYQLKEYFAGKRKQFHLPLNPQGTSFQKKVWDELLKIPYGEVVTYKEIAERIGKKGAHRAVGNANHHNPIPIIIPCHRVVMSNQKLGGYAFGTEKKNILLCLEKNSQNQEGTK